MVTFVASLPAASSSTSSSSSSSSSSSTSSSPPALPLLKIPNLVVRENLVEALKGCLTGHYAIVQQMLRDPSIESVRICLETCLRSTVTPMDKFFSESAAQKALETYFVHVLLNTGNFKLWVADGEGYQQGVVRPDLVFLPVDGKSIVHVELKIVRPQHLEPACGDRDATIADAALKQLRESIRRESDDTRRRRTIVEQFAGGRQHSVDVLEAETRAKSLNVRNSSEKLCSFFNWFALCRSMCPFCDESLATEKYSHLRPSSWATVCWCRRWSRKFSKRSAHFRSIFSLPEF